MISAGRGRKCSHAGLVVCEGLSSSAFKSCTRMQAVGSSHGAAEHLQRNVTRVEDCQNIYQLLMSCTELLMDK